VFAHNAVLPDTARRIGVPIDPVRRSSDPTASGDSDVLGDDAIVALGYDSISGSARHRRWSSTTMLGRWLGHNFGLVHGSLASAGQHCIAYKPNYVSVMGITRIKMAFASARRRARQYRCCVRAMPIAAPDPAPRQARVIARR
jgi:hypothetical protein